MIAFTPACIRCRFVDNNDGVTTCRLRPPMMDMREGCRACWPNVAHDDWCSQFELDQARAAAEQKLKEKAA